MKEDKEKQANEESALRELTARYSGETLPSTTTVMSFKLVKESDGWKIFKDWAGVNNARAAKMKSNLAYAREFLHFRDVEVTFYADQGSAFVKGWVQNDGPKTAQLVQLSYQLLDNNGLSFTQQIGYVAGDLGPHHQTDIIESFSNVAVPKGWKKKVHVEVEQLLIKD